MMERGMRCCSHTANVGIDIAAAPYNLHVKGDMSCVG